MSDQQSLEAIKMALEESLEGLQIVDENWRYIYVNAAAATQGRRPKEDLLEKTMMECYPGIETTLLFSDLQYVMEKRIPRTFENEFNYPDGKKCWFELHIEPNSRGVLIRSLDITVRKSIEAQLRHSQKMEAIGRLAGGIAHDFNNKLAIMLAYTELAKSKVQGSGDILEDYIDKILTSISTSANLTRQLLAFSRRQVLNLQVADLNALLKENKDGLSKLIGEEISIHFELSPELNKVRIDCLQMDQVILNLCINARDSMPEGGHIHIKTANIHIDESHAFSHPELIPGQYVMLSVSDSGSGMDRETLDRIFEPFYSTKATGKGTGLGLSSVHGIINQSRGHIEVSSKLDQGTEFKIYLPAVHDSEFAKSEDSAALS